MARAQRSRRRKRLGAGGLAETTRITTTGEVLHLEHTSAAVDWKVSSHSGHQQNASTYSHALLLGLCVVSLSMKSLGKYVTNETMFIPIQADP